MLLADARRRRMYGGACILNLRKFALLILFAVFATTAFPVASGGSEDNDATNLRRLEQNLGLAPFSLNPSSVPAIEEALSVYPSSTDGAPRASLGDLGRAFFLWKLLKELITVRVVLPVDPPCTDTTCIVPPLSFCQPTTGDCVECLIDGTCENPSFPFCLGNACSQCIIGRESGEGSCDVNAARTVCLDQGSRAVCVECMDDGDCSAPNSVCNLAANVCVQCMEDADCPSAAATCSDTNVCQTCVDENDCALCPPNIVCTPLFQETESLPATAAKRRLMAHTAESRLACRMCSEAALQCPANRPLCDYGVCVQCVDSFDCSETAPFCDGQGHCRPCADGTDSCLVRGALTTCEDDSQCTGTLDPICNVDGDPNTPNSCVECLVDGDCPFPTAYCREDHVCVACLTDNDCGPPNPFCSPTTNRCVTCLDDSQCASPLPFCSEREGECVQCTSSSECPDPAQPACELGALTCVECTADADCTGSLNPWCDTEAFTCAPLCESDADCPATLPSCQPTGECIDLTPPPAPPAPPTCTTPEAPTNIRLESTTDTGATICWDAPVSATQCDVNSYNVILTTGGVSFPGSSTAACYELLLPCDQQYSITVQSVSNVGGVGGTSPPLSFSSASCATCLTAPGPPAGLAAAAGSPASSSVTLDISWSVVADANAYEYFCVVDGGSCQDTPVGSGLGTTVTGTSGSITSLDPYTTYTCWVRASNDCGSTCSASGVTETTSCVTDPGAPTNLGVAPGSTGGSSVSLDITWDAVGDATSYNFFCVPAGGSCVDTANAAGSGVGTATGTATSAAVTGLDPYTSYTCFVKSVNGCGSICSTGVTQSTSCIADPAPPTNLVTSTAAAGSVSSITISWAVVADATSYSYFCVPEGGSCDPSTAQGSGASSTSVQTGTISDLQPSTTYTCWVQTLNDCGDTCATEGVPQTTACSAAPPSSPTPTLTAPAGGVTMDLAWASVTDPTVTKLEAFCTLSTVLSSCPDPTSEATGTVSTVTTGISGATSYTVTGLSGSTAYSCFVRITNDCGTTCSSAAGLTTACSAAPPSSPTPTLTAPAGGVTMDLAWASVTDPTVTKLEAFCTLSTVLSSCPDPTSEATGTVSTVTTGISGATSYTVTGLSGSTAYSCFVRITNDCGTTCSSAAGLTTPCSSLPASPSGLASVSDPATSGKLDLSWTGAAGETYLVKCVDDSSGIATCSDTAAGAGQVSGICNGGSPPQCAASVTGLTDETPYTCCVVAVDSGGCESLPASTLSPTKPCTTPIAPAITSVVASASTSLTIFWGSVSNAVTYNYFCAASGGTCGSSPVGTGGLAVPSSPGTVTGLTAAAYSCFVESVNSCGTTCSTASSGVICSISAPSNLRVTGATDDQLDLTWDAATGASTYDAFCVLKVGAGAGTQTCGDTQQGTSTVAGAGAGTTASITGLSQSTVYVCYVKSIDSNGCASTCSAGVEYITSQTGTSSLLAEPTLTTLVFDDGAGPNSPLSASEQPAYFYDESTCTNANEFPDENNAAGRRALQIILNVEGYDKPAFENSVDIQAKYYKALSDNIADLGFGPVCMRIFNVDNSRHGAGVKTRIWFETQADCVDYAEYIFNTVMVYSDLGMMNVFRDINYGSNNQFDPSTFGLPGTTSGGVTVRMVTNPMSRCHKWNFPDASVCSAQLDYFEAGATSQPLNPTRNNDAEMCPDEETAPGLPDGPNSNSGYQVIFSLSARTKISGTTVPPYGYQDDPTFQTHVVSAFQSYFTSSGFSPKLMQIKNLDNSQAGVGLFVRLFAANAEKSRCDVFAAANYPLNPSLTQAEVDAADNFLADNIFTPYEVANGLGTGYFGTVTLRASMSICRNIGNNSVLPDATTGVNPGANGWVGDPMAQPLSG